MESILSVQDWHHLFTVYWDAVRRTRRLSVNLSRKVGVGHLLVEVGICNIGG